MKAILLLEDGKHFFGETKSKVETAGPLTFNTGVVGYQEFITDPTNVGKILVLTYPLIGNYGCNDKFSESKKAWVKAIVVKKLSSIYSNWQADLSLEEFARKEGFFILTDIDTRSLMVHLREKGLLWGIISTENFNPKKLLSKLREFQQKSKKSLLAEISTKVPKIIKGRSKRIAILDLGITNSILTQLKNLGLCLVIFPFNTEAKEILKLKPEGLIISSGPEEDLELERVAENVRALLGKIPILGISTGCQVLARSLGAKLMGMKLGHHGLNYPIKRPHSLKGEITYQNHSYTIEEKNLKGIEITAFNLNDKTVEEIESKKYKFIGIQYLPLSPGFDEVHPIFKRFLKLTERS